MLHGYPGLDGVDKINGFSSQVVVQARRTPSGYVGGLGRGDASTIVTEPNVVLATGQQASALFEGSTGVVASQPCPSYSTLVVTPPNETHSVRIASTYNLCYLEIHPVVPGMTGGAVDYGP